MFQTQPALIGIKCEVKPVPISGVIAHSAFPVLTKAAAKELCALLTICCHMLFPCYHSKLSLFGPCRHTLEWIRQLTKDSSIILSYIFYLLTSLSKMNGEETKSYCFLLLWGKYCYYMATIGFTLFCVKIDTNPPPPMYFLEYDQIPHLLGGRWATH